VSAEVTERPLSRRILTPELGEVIVDDIEAAVLRAAEEMALYHGVGANFIREALYWADQYVASNLMPRWQPHRHERTP
jgi:hypothetical protein